MRGRLHACRNPGQKSGNTPAYAGKTRRDEEVRHQRRKHPRVCGEDRRSPPPRQCGTETPPRMRGRRVVPCPVREHEGNTPAYAGKTGRIHKAAYVKEKHPRVCGEDWYSIACRSSSRETPPRMRGRHYRTCGHYRLPGNTPAYAGKTFPPAGNSAVCRKHPRVCGEDSATTHRSPPPKETPPRMRGRRNGEWGISEGLRNTPAYAGKTHDRI